MGAAASVIDPRHVRIWNNLSALESTSARIQMLETLLVGQEYIASAKQVGIYGTLLAWIAAQRRGEFYAWPEVNRPVPTPQRPIVPAQRPVVPVQQPVQRAVNTIRDTTTDVLARVPPPKRALDYLHEAYGVLNIDDSKPLTHEILRTAYKRAATKAHPDKGGTPEAFDAVTRAFLYVQEVLNKLIPKTATDGSDPRFTAPVTMDEALKARGVTKTAPAAKGVARLEDAPPVALNPKKLDMTLFNKLFEENRLPDPEGDDGYGDWLKSNDGPDTVSEASSQKLRSKFNSDVFHKTFEAEALKQSRESSAVAKYNQPAELVLAPTFGTELGGERPSQYTRQAGGGAGIGYTDLKYAYGDGATFSQQVTNVSLDGRPKNLEEAKREYGTAPRALTADEMATAAAFDRVKERAEEERRKRMATRDVDAEALHARLQKRLMIQQ
jgi:hypothetical protein